MKTITKLLVIALLTAAFGVLSETPASAVMIDFCFFLDVDYSLPDRADGDYWTGTSNQHAYGVRAKIKDNDSSATPFDGWLDTTGIACTGSLSLDIGKSYYVRLYSKAKDDNDNTIQVYTGSSGSTLHQQTVDWDYDPPLVPGTAFYVYEIINQEHETNVLAAASFAVREHPAGISSNNFYFHTHTPGDVGAYFDGVLGRVYLDQIAKDAKTGTTHELGHYIGWKRDSNQAAECDYGDTGEGDPDCDSTSTGHYIDSREWQTAAAYEGLAHFYAAATWNDESESDCEFRGEDCEGGTTGHQVDWLDQCDGNLTNKGNELDWLRFWWDLHTDLDASVADIFLIWGDANPHNWDSSQVFARLRQHAPSHGISTGNFEAWGATNGNNHGVWP